MRLVEWIARTTGEAPCPRTPPERGALGVRRGGAPRQPLPGTREAWPQGVCWLTHLKGRKPALPPTASDAVVAGRPELAQARDLLVERAEWIVAVEPTDRSDEVGSIGV